MTRQVEVLVSFDRRQAAARRRGPVCRGPRRDRQHGGPLAARRIAIVRDGDNAFAWRVKDGKLQKVALKLGDRDPRTGELPVQRPRRRRQGAALSDRHAARRPGRRSPAHRARLRSSPKTTVPRGSMFLSNFSIKQPVTTVAIVIVLMCLGLLAIKNLRVNQIPDVRAAGDGGARSRTPAPRRKRWSARSSTASRSRCRAFRRSTRSARRPPRAARRSSSIFNFKKNMVEAADEIRNAIASVRYKLPMEMREPVLFRDRSVRAADHAAGAVVADADARRDLAAGRGRARRPVPRHRRRGDGQRERLAAPRAVGAAARAEAARVQRLGGRSGERAARAEHHRAGGPRQGRAGRAEHPPRRPHRVAAASSRTSS